VGAGVGVRGNPRRGLGMIVGEAVKSLMEATNTKYHASYCMSCVHGARLCL